jgi:hypothetical protein
MRAIHATPHGRVRLAGLAIAVIGLVAAAIVYFTASGQADVNAVGYEMAGGNAYAITLQDSQRELQQLERIGGKSAVLTLQFRLWFASLWHGRRLAWTLAGLSLALALLCFHIASLMAEDGVD